MEQYHSKNQSFSYGCYTARKINEHKNDTVTDLPVNMKLYDNEEEHKKLNTHGNEEEESMSDAGTSFFETESDLVQEINSRQRLWSATVYPEFEKLTKKQLQAKLGHSILYKDDLKRKDRKHRIPVSPIKNSNAETEEDSMLSDNESAMYDFSSDIKAKPLPKEWDWRNVSGVNYVSPVRDQGGCGSCYTFATLAALESRIRILTNNKEQVILAPQDIVSCCTYNQNCSGGFPYLVGKHVQDFTLVPEECFKYEQSPSVPCSKKCTNPRLKVTIKRNSYGYIGGFYGASNDETMMREIYKNGPIPVSYLIYSDFKYYKKGIYSNVKAELVDRKAHLINDFEATTHSVAIVGWGEENDVKYWIAKNSWGDFWGEKGYFKIKRGVDEAAIEAQAVNPGIPVLHYSSRRK
jgi:cathepsin C